MRKKQVWRYYCDHCGKGSLSGGHMRNHERHCTANPNRECRMHKHFDEPQRPVAELMAALDELSRPDYGLPELRRLAGNCPMCILAAVRQSGITKWDGDPESPPLELDFNFKNELKAHWETINQAQDEREYR